MLRDEINSLIMASMKAKDKARTTTLQLIKSEMQKAETAAGAKPYDEVQEIAILRRVIKQREDSIAQYLSAGREDLANEDEVQMNIIKEFMPAEITAEQIETEIDVLIQGGIEPSKKSIGLLIKSVKSKYPTADGGLVSKLVQQKIA